MRKFILTFSVLFAAFCVSGCRPDDNSSSPETETINYYGTLVPYLPIEEKDLP